MNKPTQLEFSSSAVDSRSVPKATTYTEIARLLARKRHRSPQEYGADSPATYRYPGSLECLMASRELPKCDEFYASQDIWGHELPQLTGGAVAQWRLHGRTLPLVGSMFGVFCMRKKDWIGRGEVFQDQDLVATLMEGLFADFAGYERDAKGICLVFHE